MQEGGIREVLTQSDGRFNQVDGRLVDLGNRMSGLETRLGQQVTELESRMHTALASKADKWEMRIWCTTILALLAAVLGIVIGKI